MKVDDPLWRKCFGHDNSELEPSPGDKPKRPRLKRHQREAKLISDHPEILRTPQRQLFE